MAQIWPRGNCLCTRTRSQVWLRIMAMAGVRSSGARMGLVLPFQLRKVAALHSSHAHVEAKALSTHSLGMAAQQ